MSARARCARDVASSIMARRSSSASCSIFATSCEVRKPSKKWRNGTRERERRRLRDQRRGPAPPATEPEREHREAGLRGRPSRRSGRRRSRARASRACAPRRACTNGVSSPAILYMFGIMRSRPCDAVNVVASAPAWSAPCTAPAAPRLGLHLDDVGDRAPEVRPALRGPLVGELAHGGGGRDRVDRDHLARAMGDRGDRLVAVEGDPLCSETSTRSTVAGAGSRRGDAFTSFTVASACEGSAPFGRTGAARPEGLDRRPDPSLRCGSRIANLLPPSSGDYSRCDAAGGRGPSDLAA